MRRLLWKELHTSRLFLALAAVVTAWMLLIGDPLWFRGSNFGTRIMWFVVIFLLLGLRTYSVELKDDTARFIYSRPIRWWEILLAKAASGVVCGAVILLLAGAVYAAVPPEQYRPFLWDELVQGTAIGALLLMAPFAFGMAVSMLMPGTALSFAALVVGYLAYSLPLSLIRWIGALMRIPATTVGYALAPYDSAFVAAVMIGGILIVRRLPGLDMKQRWLTWLKPLVTALVLGAVLGILHIPSLLGLKALTRSEGLQPVGAYGLSPNGAWVVYGEGLGQNEVRRLELVSTTDARVERTWDATEPIVSAWSQDSRRFAYLDRLGVLRIVDVSGRPAAIAPVTLPIPPEVLDQANFVEVRMSWSPDGGRLGFLWDQSHPGGPVDKSVSLTFETHTRTVHTTVHPADIEVDKALTMPAGTPVSVDYTNIVWPPGWGPVRK